MTPEQLKHLWRLLGQTWGSRFAENYGPTPNEAWSAALESITVDAAKYALRKLVLSGSPHPPTLPEFLVLARSATPPAKVLRFYEDGRVMSDSLPPERELASPETNRENIRKLREMLRDVGR